MFERILQVLSHVLQLLLHIHLLPFPSEDLQVQVIPVFAKLAHTLSIDIFILASEVYEVSVK